MKMYLTRLHCHLRHSGLSSSEVLELSKNSHLLSQPSAWPGPPELRITFTLTEADVQAHTGNCANTSTQGRLPLKTSSGNALTFQGIISKGEIAAEYFMGFFGTRRV